MADQGPGRLLATSAIVVGYAMSRLDALYLRAFEQRTWNDAFGHAGSLLGVKPESLKNLRDEFDPIHANPRRGWHKRPLRKSRQRVLAELCDVSNAALVELVARILRNDVDVVEEAVVPLSRPQTIVSNVAERLLTGRLAEAFFLNNCRNIVGLEPSKILDRRDDACGFDFGVRDDPETAIEVKGLAKRRGGILFTDREWREAALRENRYLVVVVGDVSHTPAARLFRNPRLSLPATCRYQQAVVAQWIATAEIT